MRTNSPTLGPSAEATRTLSDRETVDREGAAAEDHFSLLGLAAMFLRRWRLVFLGIALGLLLGTLYVVVRPPIYTAAVVLVPSTERGSMNPLAAQLPAGLANLAGVAEPTDRKLIVAILKSRTLADSIFSRFHPGQHDRSGRDVFVSQLRKRTETKQTADGSYVVEVKDRDAERAAEIANEYPRLVNAIAADIGRQAIEVKRRFLDRQLDQARDRLSSSEQHLLDFQVESDAPEIQEQARQTVQAAAELQREIFLKEVEVQQLSRAATSNNPQLQAAAAELNALRSQLRRLTGGTSSGSHIFLPLKTSPEVKAGAVRLLREYTRDEQVYLALTAALAETQIDVKNNLPVISTLDSAQPPIQTSGVSPLFALILTGWLGLIAGLALAASAEYVDGLRRDSSAPALHRSWHQFKAELRRLFKRGS